MSLSAQIKKPLASSIQRLVIVFILFAICYLLFAIAPANAQTTYNTNWNPDVPRDQHSYVQSVTIEILASMVCQLAGFDPIKRDQKCLGIDTQTGKIGFVENGGGAIGMMGHFIALTYTAPVSSGDYVNYLAGNFGLAKKTYAQNNQGHSLSNCENQPGGVGICGIRPLISIWVAMRNIAYLLFVIIFIIIGLAIMFRVHIDPRTVMTIENQIPKIIAGILLVTFSFALAGLLIDVMYVAIYLVSGVLVQSYPFSFPANESINTVVTAPTPFDAINRLWGGGFAELSAQGKVTIESLVTSVLGGQNFIDPITNFRPSLWDLIGDLFKAMVGLIVGILAFVVILLGLIYTSIRLWVILVVAYVSILLDVVFAPFWFLLGLLPGSSAGVGAWFKDMLANLAVFPTALAMFILGKIFSDIALFTSKNSAIFFTPPLAGGGFNQGTDGNAIFAGIIALGFIFMTPHVLQITRSAIKAPNINYGPVFQPAGAGVGTLTGAASLGATYFTKPLPKPDEPGGLSAVGRRLFKAGG